jgi:hypothetical protein
MIEYSVNSHRILNAIAVFNTHSTYRCVRNPGTKIIDAIEIEKLDRNFKVRRKVNYL